jgi:hypothetical protein
MASPSEQGSFIQGVVRAAQDYAIPRMEGATHKDAGMLWHVIEDAMAVTDAMVDQALRAWYDWPPKLPFDQERTDRMRRTLERAFR